MCAQRSRELSSGRTRFGLSARRITKNISGKLVEAISHRLEALQQCLIVFLRCCIKRFAFVFSESDRSCKFSPTLVMAESDVNLVPWAPAYLHPCFCPFWKRHRFRATSVGVELHQLQCLTEAHTSENFECRRACMWRLWSIAQPIIVRMNGCDF